MSNANWRFLRSVVGGVAVVGACAGGVLLVRSGGAAAAAPTVRFQSDASPANSYLAGGTMLIPAGAIPATEVDTIAAEAPASGYRNGRYNATGHYATPGGDESIEVTVDVSGGLVTSAEVHTEALSPTALQFQEQFREHVTVQVVGRDLASVSVSRVAGASLTSVGFNDALGKIKLEAGA